MHDRATPEVTTCRGHSLLPTHFTAPVLGDSEVESPTTADSSEESAGLPSRRGGQIRLVKGAWLGLLGNQGNPGVDLRRFGSRTHSRRMTGSTGYQTVGS